LKAPQDIYADMQVQIWAVRGSHTLPPLSLFSLGSLFTKSTTLALCKFVSASAIEDTYGTVQKNFSEIITSLVNLLLAYEKFSLSFLYFIFLTSRSRKKIKIKI